MIVPMFTMSPSCHMMTRFDLGMTKSFANLSSRSFVASRSDCVKNETSPSLNESGMESDVGVTISMFFSSNTDFIA